MSGDIWNRDEVESPCVKVCVIEPASKLCVGCYRTAGEIAAWSGLAPAERRAIMAALPARAPLLTRRRGGRRARVQD